MKHNNAKVKIVVRAQGYPDFVVNRQRSTLINTNSGARRAYVAERNRLRKSNRDTDNLKNQIESLNIQMEMMQRKIEELARGNLS